MNKQVLSLLYQSLKLKKKKKVSTFDREDLLLQN